MTNKIEELTKKIYNEGVVKAQEDADAIIADAKSKSEEIIKSAKKQQQEIIEQANKQAIEIKTKTETELKLAARQFTSKLKQEITNSVCTAQLSSVPKAFNDIDFIKQIITKTIDNWNASNLDGSDIKLFLPENQQKEFDNFFEKSTLEILNKGIEVRFEKKLDNGFKIGPKGDGFQVSFTDKDFENYFKIYLKDKTKRLLFDKPEEN